MSIVDPSPEVNSTELAVALAGLRALEAPQLGLAAAPVRLSGGFWAEMWMLSLKNCGPQLPQRVVLRLAPDEHASIRETVIQRGVAEQGYQTPAIIASGGATASTRAWSVMAYASGRQLLSGLSGLGALVRLPSLAASLPRDLARSMAALHALDAAPIEIALAALAGFDGATDGRGGVAGLLDMFAAQVARLESPSLAAVVTDLKWSMPVEARLVICHGDLHPFNILADHETLTVLDWTASVVAGPAFDVTYTAMLLANAPLKAPRLVQPVIAAAARALSRRFVREYGKAAGSSPLEASHLIWYTRLHAARIAIELAEWRAAGVAGEHSDHPWFSLEPTVELLLRTG